MMKNPAMSTAMVPRLSLFVLFVKMLLIQDYIHTTAAQVLVSPSEIIAYEGGPATFLCITSSSINTDTIRRVQWFINEVSVENLQHDTEEEFFPDNENLGRLRFTDTTLDLDMSSISCAAEFEAGSTESSSTQSVLRVQGVLAIGLVNVSTTDFGFSVTWPEPHTLAEYTDTISYCVDVINSTSSMTLHPECGITETEFYYPIPLDVQCTGFIFNVSAINGAGIGEPSTAVYKADKVSKVDDVLCVSVPSGGGGVNSKFVYRLVMNQLVCNAQVMSFIDLYTNDTVKDVTVTPTEQNITLSATGLQFNRRYDAILMVNNSGGSVVLTTNISSHPIVNATVRVTENGAIVLLTEYFRHSYESGALYLFRLAIDDTWALVALNREDSNHYTLPFRLPAGDYNVFVYDIEPNGTILSGVAYPAYTRNEFTVPGAQDQGHTLQTMFSRLDGCTVTTVQRRIDVACTYSSHSGTTGFQVIVQRQNQGDKLYVSQTNQMLASVMVEESGMYLVIILAIEGAAGITTDSATAAEYAETVTVMVDTQDSVGSNIVTAVAVTLVVVLIVCAGVVFITAIVAYTLKRKNRVNNKTNGTNGNKEEMADLELSPQYPAKGQLDGPDLYSTHEIGSSSVPPDHGMPNRSAIELNQKGINANSGDNADEVTFVPEQASSDPYPYSAMSRGMRA